jgi:hypothetical protein
MYRQKDISLHPIRELPDDCYKSENGNVLAIGEASGHRHWIDVPETVVYEDFEGNLYVQLLAEAVLLHIGEDLLTPAGKEDAKEIDLHMPISISKGVYQVKVERDFDPYSKKMIPVLY